MSDDDADWFERALDELESESDESDEGAETAADADDADGSPDSSGDDSGAFVDFGPGREEAGDGDGAWTTPESGPPGDVWPDDESADDAWADLSLDDGDDAAAGSGDEGGDFGFEDFGDGTGGDFGVGGGSGGERGDFGFGGGSGGERGDFGFGDFDSERAGGGDDFGFGGGSRTDEFDDEAFESDIGRIEIGIEGLDEMILGGIPERAMIAAVGSAGTGKTTFGLQFLHTALANDQRGVYITLEESQESIVDTADEKGWNFSEHVAEGRLAVIDLHPIEMANSLATIRDDLPRLIEEFGAERLVLDSVSLLEMMYDRPSERRSEVFEFARALKDAGVTTFVTSEASEESPYASRYGIIEYLADAVFVLQYVRPSDFRETRLAVEIQKIRDANHSRETKPYEITNSGISVYRQANIF